MTHEEKGAPQSPQTAGHGLDKAEWQHRCVDAMLAIKPDVDVIEATQLAIAMWSIERFRERGPEEMARVVFGENAAIRPSSR